MSAPAAELQTRFEEAWRRAIAESALLALDVELNAQGLVHAAISLERGFGGLPHR